MNRKRKRESVKYWRIPQVNGVDLLNASYVTQTFSKHTHEGYAVGVVESGALGFAYRGETLVAGPGTVNLVIPGEPHTGFSAAEEGWTYRMFVSGCCVDGTRGIPGCGPKAKQALFPPGGHS